MFQWPLQERVDHTPHYYSNQPHKLTGIHVVVELGHYWKLLHPEHHIRLDEV